MRELINNQRSIWALVLTETYFAKDTVAPMSFLIGIALLVSIT